jgi:hypothetical protein
MKLKTLVISFALALVVFLPVYVCAEEESVTTTLQELVGEDRIYHIDFLFFRHLGEGVLRFEETDQSGVFRAELIGRTLGIASWLSGERVQVYTSIMQLMPDGSLSSVEHVSNVKKKKRGQLKRYSKVCQFDCVGGMILQEKIKDGKVVSSEEHDIPEGKTPVDMLTAFYNFRLGVYGELKRGDKVSVPTYSSKGFTEIEIEVLTEEEQKKKRYFPENGVLVKAVIDPEVFETDSGNLYIWFDEQANPTRGIIEDMIGLGDIKGYQTEEVL